MPSRCKRGNRRHAGERTQASSAQPLQQDGFELVVRVMRSQQHLVRLQASRKCRVARLAGRRFRAAARCRACVHTELHQWHAELRRLQRAPYRPGCGINLQAVIDVGRAQRQRMAGLADLRQAASSTVESRPPLSATQSPDAGRSRAARQPSRADASLAAVNATATQVARNTPCARTRL